MKFLQIVLMISSLFLISCKKDMFFSDREESKIASLEKEEGECSNLAGTKESFYSCEGKIFDASGSEFTHRGVNMPLAYFKSQSKGDISKVVKAGFNSGRYFESVKEVNLLGMSSIIEIFCCVLRLCFSNTVSFSENIMRYLK